ncbi:MAG: zinc-binding dehydrogenase [Bacteroidetes bacterium]|nr:zinc-binding dehydrogenase [Bacteroidota bacterium]MCL5027298.1 zinc-binding dehydrogenase [Chloroflexota bacterium]
MKGVVFLGDRTAKVIDLPKPSPGPGEVLIQIKASGICGSDLNTYRRPAAELTEQARVCIRGHEPCGVVAELGPSTRNVSVGDRVMVHHYYGCGTCKYCLAGWPQLCATGKFKLYGGSANGGHEEFMVVPDVCCVPMPDGMSFEVGASCACGTGTAYQALKRLQPSGLDTLAVYGQGPVGLSAVLIGKALGARVIGIDTMEERLALAKRFGADEVIDASKTDPVAAIRELTNGEGAECALDCTGKDAARVNMLKSTKLWGRACLVGEGGTLTVEPSPVIIHKHLTVYGSWTFSTHILAEAAKFVVWHKLPLRDLITQTFPLAEGVEAYKLFDTQTTGKIALIP